MRKIIIFLILLLSISTVGGVNEEGSRSLDGVDNTIQIANADLSTWYKGNKSQITIEYKVYINAVERNFMMSDYGSQMTNGIDTAVQGYSAFRSYFVGTTGGWTESTTQLYPGIWYHIAITYNGAIRIHYINGKNDSSEAETGTITGQSSNAYFHLGEYASLYANIRIDELRIWNYARTQAQIQSNMDKILADEEEGLEFYWRFDEPTGMPFDRSGNGNHATSITGTLAKNNCPIKRKIGD